MKNNSSWKRALNMIIQRAKASQPNALEIVLYGSRARGDYEKVSDIDLLVIARESDQKEQIEEACVRIANELSLEYDLVFSVFVVDAEHYRRSFEPLIINIRREGKRVA
jgi:predicted nucleotidyltransferase